MSLKLSVIRVSSVTKESEVIIMQMSLKQSLCLASRLIQKWVWNHGHARAKGILDTQTTQQC